VFVSSQENGTQPLASQGDGASTVSYDQVAEAGDGSPLPSDDFALQSPLVHSVVKVLTGGILGRISRSPKYGPIRISVEVPDDDTDLPISPAPPPSPAPVHDIIDCTEEEIRGEYGTITPYEDNYEWEEEAYPSRPPSPSVYESETEGPPPPSPRAVSFYETLKIHDDTFGEIPTQARKLFQYGFSE